jgi:hypothetical protein
MSKYTFLYKENVDDRDCVAYIDLTDLKNRHLCIDGKFNIHGACYCMSLCGRNHDVNYEDIKTILTEEEFNLLCNPDGTDLASIIEKLESEENQALFEEVIEEEKEYLMDEYGFDEDDIEQIFDEYYLSYKDRGIVGCVYDDVYDLGYETAWSFGYVKNDDSIMERYFDFEKFGEDLLEEESYMQLSDGRCVALNY